MDNFSVNLDGSSGYLRIIENFSAKEIIKTNRSRFMGMKDPI